MKLSNYDDWKHCITVSCGIPLTPDYIEKRVARLNDPSDFHTQQFVKTYGDEHLQRVIGWFEKARGE